MVIVYTYRNDGNDGFELRYSIRSMCKYFTDLTDLILVTTTPPPWYSGKYVPFFDIPDKPGESIIIKMLGAGVEDFLWCADDHFALKTFDSNLPNYYNHHARYVDSKIKKMVTNCPNDWLNYICHTPMVINRTKLQAAFDWADGREFPVKTLYANFNKLPGTRLIDCKFRGNVSYQEIKDRIANRPFFSTHENAMQPDMMRVLNELYPLPSPYECQ